MGLKVPKEDRPGSPRHRFHIGEWIEGRQRARISHWPRSVPGPRHHEDLCRGDGAPNRLQTLGQGHERSRGRVRTIENIPHQKDQIRF